MTLDDLKDKVTALAEEAFEDAVAVTAEQLGIDKRAVPLHMWRGTDYLAIHSSWSGVLGYYGGFEYVDKDCIACIGEHVFYSTMDPRVFNHWDNATPEVDEQICGSCNGSGEGCCDDTVCTECHGVGTIAKGV